MTPDALDVRIKDRLMHNPRLRMMLCQLLGEELPARDIPAEAAAT